MTPAQILARVRGCGYRIELATTGPRLLPIVPGAIMPPGLLGTLKWHRDDIIAYLTACSSCGRDVSDPENREQLSGVNYFCHQPHCPYRNPGDP